MIAQIKKYYYTLAPVKSRQITLRIWGVIKRFLYAKETIYQIDTPRVIQEYLPLRYDFFNTQDAMLEGKFIFLNRDADIGWMPNWHSKKVSLLWLYNLHYFYFLEHLSEDASRQIIHDWIDQCSKKTSISWHPYPTSIRISSWLKKGVYDKEILSSIADQVEYLFNNLEMYHPANHMIENMKAVLHFALVFPQYHRSEYYMNSILKIFMVEMDKQLLSDGAHFELSPMYHIQVMTILLDLMQVSDSIPDFRVFLESRLLKMARYLKSILHPDGRIPLLNDSSFSNVPAAATILSAVESITASKIMTRSPSEITSYTIFRNDKFFLIYDNMEVGPSFIPAHAHSDIFSYELSIGGVRVITDSGVYEYEAGKRRNQDRHSSAHNCLTIDGTGPAHAWASFRVAERAVPKSIKYIENKTIVSSLNKYYRVKGGISHTRQIDFNEVSIIITDSVESKYEHAYVSHIHLHPEVRFSEQDGDIFEYSRNDIIFKITIQGGVGKRSNSTYSPMFGVSFDREELSIHYWGKGLNKIRYIISI